MKDQKCILRFLVKAHESSGNVVMFALMQVSEWRHGEVGEADLAGTVVIKPLAGQGSQTVPSAEAHGHAEEEEEEEQEEGAESAHCNFVNKLCSLKLDVQL
jgi:hypothetical protein